MKKSEFEKVAVDILGEKWYDAFDGKIPKSAREAAIKLFLNGEFRTERADVIRDLLNELYNKGSLTWEKEDET